jgi:hypothetical protein
MLIDWKSDFIMFTNVKFAWLLISDNTENEIIEQDKNYTFAHPE